MEDYAQSILRFEHGKDWKDQRHRIEIFLKFLGNESRRRRV